MNEDATTAPFAGAAGRALSSVRLLPAWLEMSPACAPPPASCAAPTNTTPPATKPDALVVVGMVAVPPVAVSPVPEEVTLPMMFPSSVSWSLALIAPAVVVP